MSDWPGSASVPPGDERSVAQPDVGGDDTAPAGRQPELDLGLVPTGDPRVDAALAPLDRLAGHPVDEHPAVYEQVHQRLQEALTDIPPQNG